MPQVAGGSFVARQEIVSPGGDERYGNFLKQASPRSTSRKWRETRWETMSLAKYIVVWQVSVIDLALIKTYIKDIISEVRFFIRPQLHLKTY